MSGNKCNITSKIYAKYYDCNPKYILHKIWLHNFYTDMNYRLIENALAARQHSQIHWGNHTNTSPNSNIEEVFTMTKKVVILQK
jgi:hypothetical protein